ncbi:interleukin-1 receptor-associated kinase 1-binding protein 1 homolog [Hetaerina americana]|uniref:interleukin-1 receptor-associated kinase 1-binding protein 1 homolog n=1 Tax=Hetaerina americana TaxID=62018 RepID=UPI003A7F5919
MNGRNFKNVAPLTLDSSGKQIAKVEGYSELFVDADVIEFEILVQRTKSSVEEVKRSVFKRIEYVLYVVKTCGIKDENDVKTRQMLGKDGTDFRLSEEVFVVCSDLKMYENISNKLTEKLDESVRISAPKQSHSSDCLQNARERAVQLSVANAFGKASQMARVSAQEVRMALYLEEIESRQEDGSQSAVEFSADVHHKLTTKLVSRVFAVYELLNIFER